MDHTPIPFSRTITREQYFEELEKRGRPLTWGSMQKRADTPDHQRPESVLDPFLTRITA